MIYVNSSTVLNAVKTATENGAAFELGDYTEGMIFIAEFSAVSGTSPTFDLKVQHSHDGSLWYDLVTFTQATGATNEKKEIAPTTGILKYMRYVLTVGGTDTPTATCKLHCCYNKLNREG